MILNGDESGDDVEGIWWVLFDVLLEILSLIVKCVGVEVVEVEEMMLVLFSLRSAGGGVSETSFWFDDVVSDELKENVGVSDDDVMSFESVDVSMVVNMMRDSENMMF